MNNAINYEADLHNHTTYSDGSMSPEELVKYAADLGLKALAITDHDTIDGIAEGITAAGKYGITLVPGLEITVRFREAVFTGSLHVLVYFDATLLEQPEFIRHTGEILSRGRGPELVMARIKAINEVFGPEGSDPRLPRVLTEKDVYAHGDRISRRHFALALKEMGFKERAEISAIIGNDSPAYIPSGVPLDALREYFKQWPLARVMAHPAAGSYPGESLYREVLPPFEVVETLLPEFIKLGLDGLEIEYPGHTDQWKRTLKDKMVDWGLTLVTGGSDCHDVSERPMGLAGVTMKEVQAIRDHLDLMKQK